MKKLTFILVLGFAAINFANAQSVAINKAGNSGNAAAALDLSDASNNALGFLMPNVSITSVNSASPVTSPPDGLIVYNTNASTTGGFGKGYYYWSSGSSKWLYLLNNTSTSSGTVTSVASGNLLVGAFVPPYSSEIGTTPMFTSSVSNPTTTPSISYSLASSASFTVFGNSTNTINLPGYTKVVPQML